MAEKDQEAALSSPPAYYPPDPNPQTFTSYPPSGSVMDAPNVAPTAPSFLGVALQDTPFWKVLPNVGSAAGRSVVQQGTVVPPPKAKSLLEAYLLGLPLGVLGAHHFYLGRPGIGLMYFLSFGLFGCGWLVDLLRMPCLVASVNKANRERYEQLQQLQLQLQQQRQQYEHQYGPEAAASLYALQSVVFVPLHPRSLVDAYIMWFPCGLFGYHHFYLGNYGMGILYHFTFGFLGIGWLIDLFRMPSLVREANSSRFGRKTYSQCTAHAFALSPAGILGGHHFYLDRPVWGSLYACTLGLLGVGWIYDWFRVSCLVKRAKAIRQGERSPGQKYLDDAYILCIPFGFTGLHHFYLHRYGWGILYFCTLGIFGIGWLIDWFRLPCLVNQYNANLELSERLISGGSGNSRGRVISTAGLVNPAQGAGTPTAYNNMSGHGYGYYQTSYLPAGAGAPEYPTTGYPAAMGQGPNVAQGEAPPSYQDAMGKSDTATKS